MRKPSLASPHTTASPGGTLDGPESGRAQFQGGSLASIGHVRPRSLTHALVAIAVCGALLGSLALALVLPLLPRAAVQVTVLYAVVFWIFVAAGLVAWWRRPDNAMGIILLGGAVAVLVGILANADNAALEAIGGALGTAIFAVIAHLLLAFPSGGLTSRTARWIVAAVYIVAIAMEVPIHLFDSPSVMHDVLLASQRVCGGAIMIATTYLLAHRVQAADPAFRRTLLPLYSYGGFAVLALAFSGSLFAHFAPDDTLARATFQLLVLAGVPLAFVWGVLRGGFRRTGELADLSRVLTVDTTTAMPLTHALAETLGDDSIRLVFRSDATGFTGEDGAPAPGLADAAARAFVEIDIDGPDTAFIEYDARLHADPRPVIHVSHIVAIALDRARLSAELQETEQQVIASRARLVEAADRERTRIAQDLHDGLQAQLVLLALEAQQIANDADATQETTRRATVLRRRTDKAAANLRELVHDLLPLPLHGGLVAAAEDLIDRMPLPTTLHIDVTDAPLSRVASNTAYFVIAESLANTVKHAQATSARVAIIRRDETLMIEVADTGLGGANTSGHGVRGLADRVNAVGGTFDVQSPPAGGTTVRAELPCGL